MTDRTEGHNTFEPQDVIQWMQQRLRERPFAHVFVCFFLGFLLGTPVFAVACWWGKAQLPWGNWLNGSGTPAVALTGSFLLFVWQYGRVQKVRQEGKA